MNDSNISNNSRNNQYIASFSLTICLSEVIFLEGFMRRIYNSLSSIQVRAIIVKIYHQKMKILKKKKTHHIKEHDSKVITDLARCFVLIAMTFFPCTSQLEASSSKKIDGQPD